MLWHKTKSGILVDLACYRAFEVRRAVNLDVYTLNGFQIIYAPDSLPSDELALGTREECEAELAEIEAKAMSESYPKMYAYDTKMYTTPPPGPQEKGRCSCDRYGIQQGHHAGCPMRGL